MIGTRLGNYRLLDRLGAGGMGVVYLAEDEQLGRQVAIKILPPELSHDRQLRERFEREARAVAALDHPNIVTLHTFEQSPSPSDPEATVYFLTMQRVEGRTLDHVIPAEGLPLQQFFALAVPLVDAITEAHGKGITHRDLKPSNVMVSATGRVRVLDFGLAKLQSSAPQEADTALATSLSAHIPEADLTGQGVIIGTAAYMSPEQSEGKPIDPRTDIFSLGVLLYQMVTGRRPFEGDTKMSVISSILRDEPKPVTEINPALPRHLGRVIRRCLEKDPGRRYQTAVDLRNELEALRDELQGTGTANSASDASSFATGVSPNSSPGGPVIEARRAPGFALMVVAVLVAVAAAVFYGPRLFSGGAAAPETAAGTGGASAGGGATTTDPATLVAVLPLEAMAGTEEDWFVDGMTRELITGLSRAGVPVISQRSVIRYKDSTEPLATIADELGVNVLVAGSVLRQGDQVRITAELIDAITGQTLWGNSYTRDIQDVLALQTEVAAAIAGEVSAEVSPGFAARASSSRRVDPEAYNAYLMGLEQAQRWTAEGARGAAEAFTRAIEIDPTFVGGHAGLGLAHFVSGYSGATAPLEAFALARIKAEDALALDPDDPTAHLVRGVVRHFSDWDFAGGEADLLRSTEFGGGAVAYGILGWLYSTTARHQEAVAALERGVELDPTSGLMHQELAWRLLSAGDLERALDEVALALELDDPAENSETFQIRAVIHGMRGEFELALAALGEYERYSGDLRPGTRGYLLAKSGDLEGARALMPEARANTTQRAEIATLYYGLGDLDSAFEWLDLGLDAREPGALFILSGAIWWEPMYSEPGFQRLRDKVGMTP